MPDYVAINLTTTHFIFIINIMYYCKFASLIIKEGRILSLLCHTKCVFDLSLNQIILIYYVPSMVKYKYELHCISNTNIFDPCLHVVNS